MNTKPGLLFELQGTRGGWPVHGPGIRNIGTIAAFMVPAFALWLPSGYSWGAVLLLVAAIAAAIRWCKPVLPDSGTLWLAASMLLMALMWAVQADPQLGGARWERAIKYILAIPCLFYLAAYPPHRYALAYGVVAGAIGACCMALWQVHGAQLERASGYTNAIQFGNLALLLAVMAAIFWACLRSKAGNALRPWTAVAVLAGVWASSLSLSRGGWLALLLALPLLLWLRGNVSRAIGRALAGVLLAVGLVWLLNAQAVLERLDLLQQELAQYTQHGDAGTSIGQRLEHWRMVWQMGNEKPVFGWGDQGYKERKSELVEAGAYDSFVLDFDHAHNEVLDLYAKRGVVGVLILLFFYAVPLYLFWPGRRRMQVFAAAPDEAGEMALALRLAGLSIPVLYMGFGLTQVFFAHNSGTMFYLFMAMLFWTALRGLERQTYMLPTVNVAGQVQAEADDTQPGSAVGIPRVLHFVTGGFSGATQVALDLVKAHAANGRYQSLLVLRRKVQTPLERVAALRQQGVPLQLVAGWPHRLTVAQLAEICRQFKPDILVAHGFSDHLWGRYAALRAGVPHMVHVEHNSRERYTRTRLRQAQELTGKTGRIVGCSQGVKSSLLELGFPPEKVVAIPNGIRLELFEAADSKPLLRREPGIVMAARFARQKDHATLLEAIALLRQRGIKPVVYLAGGGKKTYQRAARRLSRKLGLQEQVKFLGFYADVPGLLMSQQICVLSSHYEGMPLSLIEGMAAGCAVVGSGVPGIQEIIMHGRNGLLAEHANAKALADALAHLLLHPAEAARMAEQARRDAVQHYGLLQMIARYESLFDELLASTPPFQSSATGSA